MSAPAIPPEAVKAAETALMSQPGAMILSRQAMVAMLEAAAPHIAAAERAREGQLDHCPGCAHRYGTGCGCECCAHVQRAVAAERERTTEWLAWLTELHLSDGEPSPFCNECGHSWPCATMRLADLLRQEKP